MLLTYSGIQCVWFLVCTCVCSCVCVLVCVGVCMCVCIAIQSSCSSYHVPINNNKYTHHAQRYVLWEAEDKGLELPYACRMGCCTACAVKVVEGEVYQPQV